MSFHTEATLETWDWNHWCSESGLELDQARVKITELETEVGRLKELLDEKTPVRKDN